MKFQRQPSRLMFLECQKEEEGSKIGEKEYKKYLVKAPATKFADE